MTSEATFDVGPLSWVKSEIDLALDRATQGLQQFGTNPSDTTQLKFCRNHLHQVRGALIIVGLDGVTQFSDALESLISDLEVAKQPADAPRIALIGKCLTSIRRYLEDLLAGDPNQPLRLFDLYRQLSAARGLQAPQPSELFFPDLNRRPQLPPFQPGADAGTQLKTARGRYQKGLLAWLKAPDQPVGPLELRLSAQMAAGADASPTLRSFWWAAGAFFAALGEKAVNIDGEIKALCARIDQQMKQQSEGARSVPDKLMRDVLFQVAVARSKQADVLAVRAAYNLQSLLPSADTQTVSQAAQLEPFLKRLREIANAAEEAWTKFSGGAGQALAAFADAAAAMDQGAERLQHTDFRRLTKAITTTANWIKEDKARCNENVALEIATGVLLIGNAVENFNHLGADFVHQVDVMVARLHACIAGTQPPTSEVPMLDEMTRRAQEKLLMAQVVREIQSSLGQVEQALDTFFREPDDKSVLAGCQKPINQIAGALTVLEHPEAVSSLLANARRIQQFAASDYQPDLKHFEDVARQLSALGFFVEALQSGAKDFASFVRSLEIKPSKLEESIATQVGMQRLAQDAATAPAPVESPTDMLAPMSLEPVPAPEPVAAPVVLAPAAASTFGATGVPSAAPANNAPEVDAELLEIFLEEANEVLGTITEQLEQVRARPSDTEALTTLRRAFHTLKGSSRMVGLMDFGEVAWGVEQVHNLWLRQEKPVDSQLTRVIELSHEVFSAWVRHFQGNGDRPDATELVAQCDQIKGGQTVAAPGRPMASEQPAEAPAAVPEASSDDVVAEGDAIELTLDIQVDAEGEADITLTEESSADALDAAEEAISLDIEMPLETLSLDEVAEPVAPEMAVEINLEPGLDIEPVELSAEQPEEIALEVDLSDDQPVEDLLVMESEATVEVDEASVALEIESDAEADHVTPVTLAEEPPIEIAEPEPVLVDALDATAPPPEELSVEGVELEASDEAIETDAPVEASGIDEIAVEALPIELESLEVDRDGSFEVSAEISVADEDIAALDVFTVEEMPSVESEIIDLEVGEVVGEAEEDADVAELEVVEATGVEDALAAQPIEESAAQSVQQLVAQSAEVPEASQQTITVSPVLYQIFVEEAQTHLASLRRCFGEMEIQPSLPTDQAMIRAAHTLGSISGTVGFPQSLKLGHGLEAALNKREKSVNPASLEALEVIRLTIAELEALVEAATRGEPLRDPSDLVDQLAELYPLASLDELPEAPMAESSVPAADEPLPEDCLDESLLPIFIEEARDLVSGVNERLAMWLADPFDTHSIHALTRLLHTLKGSARMSGAMRIGALTHRLESAVENAHRAGGADPSLICLLQANFDDIAEMIDVLASGEVATEIDDANPSDESDANSRISVPVAAEPVAEEPALQTNVIELGIADVAEVAEAAEVVAEEPILAPVPDNDLTTAEVTVDAPMLVDAEPEMAIALASVLEAPVEADVDLSLDVIAFAEPEAPSAITFEAESIAPIAAEDRVVESLIVEEVAVSQTEVPEEVTEAPAEAVALSLDASPIEIAESAEIELIMPTADEEFSLDLDMTPYEVMDEAVAPAIVDVVSDFAEVPAEELVLENVPGALVLEPVSPAPELAPVPAPVVAMVAAAEAVPSGSEDVLDPDLLPIFLEEAVEIVKAVYEQLDAWQAAPNDGAATSALARSLHTLKGSARMAGAMTLGALTHTLESRAEEATKSGQVSVGLIEEMKGAFDIIAHVIEGLQRGESLSSMQVELPAPISVGPTEQVAPQLVVEPGVTESVTAAAPAAAQTVAQTRKEVDAKAMLRVRADLVDHLVNDAGELSIVRARIEDEMRSLKQSMLDLTENVIRLRRQLREIEIQAESQMASRVANTPEVTDGFDPLEMDRFTRFQEVTRMMAESVNDVATVQQNLLKNLDEANAALAAQGRLNRELQQSLMSVRMVPFSTVSERLGRIVRQTAKELNKRADLDVFGATIELDQNVINRMVGPLEHLLRNAIAHGIEQPVLRVEHGKGEIGEIRLTLKQEGNEVIITMQDDGAGLDFSRIREKAISKGLMRADDPYDEHKLTEMIFSSGFSTATEVSQVAGRGVGMDVVMTEVTSLGGRIEIHSETGKGSTFRIYLPLTLAVTNAVIVRVGVKVYAIPSSMVDQVQEIKEEALANIRLDARVDWMGNRYPFHFLPHLLGEPGALPEARRMYWLMMLHSGLQRVSIQVDELIGTREVVVKNIGPQLARVVGIAGATVLGDGKVVLILNPVALSTRAPVINIGRVGEALPSVSTSTTETPQSATAPVVPTAPVAPQPIHLPTIMVVDDSLTVRKVTGRLLAREGYQVITAKDGIDALEQLIEVVPDVILSDIEMPRMDGFELARNIKADERLRNIPIVMISSRTADKHRSHAAELGVNHFLGKPYQEEELLGLITEFLALAKQA